ncbi:DUF2927 domain-containing protein [Paracoccus sp. JM45]|uniref:DUF2927 domain-containing protein n=1 Tax=Paracoccus sp. JM45 TaxID=2283626 RepID=UPI000E6D2D95|nr:DUF2927 domain-containing protein [Paracoccus sp. JM45]RJE81673.1 DUF2927 domain-containing protein [Paracoccus sp. JM45]
MIRSAISGCSLLASGALVLLTACAKDPTPEAVTSDRPDPRPAIEQPNQPTQAELRKARAERNRAANAVQTSASAASQTQSDYYGAMQRRLIAQGKLRRDRVPQDAPITAESLTRDFIAIALRDEYSRSGDGLVSQARTAPLRRWEQPVRVQLEFGASTEIAARPAWRSEVAGFANRLSSATRHPVTMTADRGNFPVLILSEDERRAIGPRLAELVPGIPASDIAILADLPPAISCTVFAYSKGNASEYAHAVAIIRAELPPLLRTSCIHEEIAQGMGLANDSPAARPSIFNDDEEFALLTRHDELLLQILYDRRLRPGMTEAQAAPIVRQIASELLGEAA